LDFFTIVRISSYTEVVLKVSSAYHAYPDSALVSLIKIGDHGAFTEIYSRYGALMYRHAHAVLKDLDACNDLVQDVFLTLWNKRETVHIVTLSAYLLKAVKNRVLDVISHEQVAEKYVNSIRDFANRGSWTVEENVQARELLAIIEAEKAKLPPRMRQIYELNREQDLSYREIGEQLDISEKTVKKQVHNALRVIRLKISSFLSLLLF